MNTFAFIGVGQMAQAIIHGLLAKSSFGPEDVCCISKSNTSAQAFSKTVGINYATSLLDLLAESSVCVLACKPQQLSELDASLSALTANKLVVSILAGTTLNTLQAYFPQARAIVRTMPNLPIKVGAGLTPFVSDKPLMGPDQALINALFGSSGTAFETTEEQIDAITTISGCGPAYFYKVVAAMAKAGEQLGLSAELAALLAKETFVGAAALLASVDTSPSDLAEQVRSKKGVTDAALNVLESKGLDVILKEAIFAAKERACQLASNSKDS